ncbi:MAG: hydrolase [Mycobacterium sp.]|nr:hydrolase [Mycobacterium sp.]
MASTSELTVGRAVDWRFAGTVGAKLARPGPPASDYTRRQVIDDLAEAAVAAESPVREVTQLFTGGPPPRPRIVDRGQWIRAASDSMRVMTGGADVPANTVTGRITGAQTGAVLAYISSGILGQYDPFADGDGDGPGGALLLVYPNVISVERQLRLTPKDFRLWVCLHEVTHRVQFTANPWLSQHMSHALGMLTSAPGEDFGQVVGRLAEFVKDQRRSAGDPQHSGVIGLMRAVQSEPQRRALDQLLVLGTLLEGHADYVMDAVGPSVVPSVASIRRRFNDRRERKQPPLQRLVRALLGVDAKLSQYTRGRAFVDHVVGAVGMERFNVVWSGPDTLPLPDEIEDPQRWIDRVL